MRLSELLKYDEIVIQCHDNPDADAIASGFALNKYFKQNGKNVKLVYSGKSKVQKSNLVLMISKLHIPIEYVTDLSAPQLLLTVDCQYGQSNVTKLEADNIAVIDHHQVSGQLPELNEVRSNLGSCSTLIWRLLADENIDVNTDEEIATALYYGLMTDTGNFSEVNHPLDKDMRDDLKYNRRYIMLFKNSNLSLAELSIAGEALMGYKYDKEHRFAIVEAKPCDPNILGMISDLTLEVDKVDSCVVYSILPYGIKFSVRSCVVEVNAGELAEYIADGIGGGGGHSGKAGGFIQRDCLSEDEDINSFMHSRMRTYFENVDIIYAARYQCNAGEFEKYCKRAVPIGFVKGTDVVERGTQVLIRTLECDMDIVIEDDIYIMIGIKGEVYPCSKEKFERSYAVIPDEYEFDGEYEPVIKDNQAGQNISLVKYAKSCVSKGKTTILAKELERRVKVFTSWDIENYMRGKKGDFLACREDDLKDIYVIERDIFFKTYEKV